MGLLCSIFGHKPPVYRQKGWWSPGEEYATVILRGVDGIGRQHAEVRGECARCGEQFLICRVHLPGTQQSDQHAPTRHKLDETLEVLDRVIRKKLSQQTSELDRARINVHSAIALIQKHSSTEDLELFRDLSKANDLLRSAFPSNTKEFVNASHWKKAPKEQSE